MKQKRLFSGLLASLFLLGCIATSATAAFTDEDSITNKDAVAKCAELNIINGKEDGSFNPTGNVTRAEMAKMITVIMRSGDATAPTAATTFEDAASHWAAGFVAYCAAEGIIAGRDANTFDPEGNVTGTEAAKMLLIVLGYDSDIAGFTGETWALNVNVQANSRGLYADTNLENPSDELDRDTAAQMIWNALNAEMVEYVLAEDEAAPAAEGGDDADKTDDAAKTDDTAKTDDAAEGDDAESEADPVYVMQNTGKTLLEVKFNITAGDADAGAEGEGDKTEGDETEGGEEGSEAA